MVTQANYPKTEIEACLSVMVELMTLLGKICAKFSTIDSPGTVWAANFLEIDDEEEKERVKRDAFERVNAFLNELRIKPFKK